MKSPRVFVSMGTPYSEEARRFRDELEVLLRDRCGIDPRIMGKNEYPSGSPLEHIRKTMRTCAGVIVVAYERKFVQSGVERRGAPNAVELDGRIYTTPWNHIESALAYSLDLPLYIICQRGLTEEGLIESKMDWWVQEIEITPSALSQPDVVESLRSWVNNRVIPTAKKSHSMEGILGHVKFSEMTPHELWTLLGMLLAAFLLGAIVGPLVPGLQEVLHLVHLVH